MAPRIPFRHHEHGPRRTTAFVRPAGARLQSLVVTLILFINSCVAYVDLPPQGRQRLRSSRVHPGALKDGNVPESRARPPRDCRTNGRRPFQHQLLSRRSLLEDAKAATAAALGVGLVGPTREAALRGAAGRTIGTGLPVAVGSWGVGLGQGGVDSAEAFGGPSRPLSRCLVNAVNAREFCTRLEADLAAGRNEQECRGMVKGVLRSLTLQECIKDAVLYLPAAKRQAAGDAGHSAVEYLASVVEFDAWDKLDKDWTSNVALRNMTPENVKFVRMALDASGSALDTFLRQFDKADVDSARELYKMYFLPAEEREQPEA